MADGGYDVCFGGEKYFSVQTEARGNQLDTFLFGRGRHVHSFEIQGTGSAVSVGVQLKDPGADAVDAAGHLLSAARIRTLDPHSSLELGRLHIDPGANRIEFAVTHGESAVSTSSAPGLPNVRRPMIELPGDTNRPATFRLCYTDSSSAASDPTRVANQVFGDRWLEFVRED